MVHILHLPVFPEGSNLNPDCINTLILDTEMPDEVAHIVLNTPNTDDARNWAHQFLKTNSTIPVDEVTFSRANDVDRFSLGASLQLLVVSFKAPFQAFYIPRIRCRQDIIDLG